MTAVVPAHRCGTVPDSHRVPSHPAGRCPTTADRRARRRTRTQQCTTNQLRSSDYAQHGTPVPAGRRPRAQRSGTNRLILFSGALGAGRGTTRRNPDCPVLTATTRSPPRPSPTGGRHRRYRRRGPLRTRSTGHERPAGAGRHVTVVGEGIKMARRDAADVGIALGTGTDASFEATDIVPAGQCPAPSSHRHRLGQLRPPLGEICARVFGYNIVVIPFAAPCARSIGSGREWKPPRNR